MPSVRNGFSRRQFLTRTGKVAGGVVAAGALAPCVTTPMASAAKGKVIGANDTINMAVIGIKGRGNGHIGGFGKIPNVKIAALCDIDEDILNKRASEVEKNFGYKPKTEYDIRKILGENLLRVWADVERIAASAQSAG